MNQNVLTIKTADAIKFFGSKSKLAQALGIRPQSINDWGEIMPELRAYKLREMHPQAFSIGVLK